jgi:hypothetical protein
MMGITCKTISGDAREGEQFPCPVQKLITHHQIDKVDMK